MPISAIEGCSAEYWYEVKNSITEVVEKISDHTFKVTMVSDA